MASLKGSAVIVLFILGYLATGTFLLSTARLLKEHLHIFNYRPILYIILTQILRTFSREQIQKEIQVCFI